MRLRVPQASDGLENLIPDDVVFKFLLNRALTKAIKRWGREGRAPKANSLPYGSILQPHRTHPE
jgi:hypothetical protein